jgi:serine/threonine protein kinase
MAKQCPICDTPYTDEHTTCPADGALLIGSVDWTIGKVVRNKYRIVSKIGQGGMGTVYKATHVVFEDLRALKVMSAALSADTHFVKRFRQEAQAAYKLQHTNIVRVMDFDQAEDGSPFIVMEFIEGISLRQTILNADGPLDPPMAIAIIRGVALGLGAAHSRKMVHRDIKPENIMLARDDSGSQVPKILDFGIVAIREGTSTSSSVLLLTPPYGAPEQWRGMPMSELDGRSDLYSLGVTFYEILTGRLPFHAHTHEGWMRAHLSERPRPPGELNPELNNFPGLDVLVLKLMAKDRDDRPNDALGLVRALDMIEPEKSRSGRLRPIPKTVVHQKQGEDQAARWAERQRLDDVLRRARKFWADQKLGECIALLAEARKDFPNDPEIARLQEAVTRDRVDQEKQQKLAEARNLLAEQRLDEAITVVQSLAKEFPDDPAIASMREVMLQQKAYQGQRERIQAEIGRLQALMEAGRFSDVVTQGEEFLLQVPAEPDISEIVNLARYQIQQLEEKQSFEKALCDLRKKLQAGRLQEAVIAAEAAQRRFPHQQELKALFEQARAGLREKEVNDLVLERIREIHRKINDGNLADALELARRTIAEFGPDEQVTELAQVVATEMATVAEQETDDKNQSAALWPLSQSGHFDASARIPRSDTLPMEHLNSPRENDAQDLGPKSAGSFGNLSLAGEVRHSSSRARIFRKGAAPITIGALIFVIAALAAAYFISRGPSTEDLALRDQAQQLEQKKDWSGALAKYEILARGRGTLATEGADQAARVRNLLDLENTFFRQAQREETIGDRFQATQLYRRVADLHGDKEQDALSSIQRLNVQNAPTYKPDQDGKSVASLSSLASARPGRSPSPVVKPSKPIVSSTDGDIKLPAPPIDCKSVESDKTLYLEMADNSRASAKYIDAERQYKEVLACDPLNDRATKGLEMTRQAMAASHHPPG